MDEWIVKRHTLITVVRETQLASDAHALVEYDPRITEYPVNSYVLFTPPVGRSNKLLPRHHGPYQVMEKTDSIYVIEDLVSGKRQHHEDAHPQRTQVATENLSQDFPEFSQHMVGCQWVFSG